MKKTSAASAHRAIINIAHTLQERGFIQEAVGGDPQVFLSEKRTVYLGMDPSAESLQVGNLVPIFLMKHLADAGHEIVFLVGEGTGMIGDPRASGERVLLDSKTVSKNTKAINIQLTSIFGKGTYRTVNNATWLSKLSLIEFLRDTAKHFTVNQLIKREIIKKRLDDENDSISFTEFSYALLQGYDFWHLNKTLNIDMQIGGSDQWTNIISGVDLIRRREGKTAYALANPIINDKKTGKKFGKSEGNAVWLDPLKTSPFEFYQFWFNTSDEGLEEYLKIFTFLPLDQVSDVLKEHEVNKAARIGQKHLAFEITSFIHGKDKAAAVVRASEILYGENPMAVIEGMTQKELQNVVEETKSMVIKKKQIVEGLTVIDLLVSSALATSKGEARRLIEGKGVSLNTIKVEDVSAVVTSDSFIKGIVILRAGKKVALLSFTS